MAFKTLKAKRAALKQEALGVAVNRCQEVVHEVKIPRHLGTNLTLPQRA